MRSKKREARCKKREARCEKQEARSKKRDARCKKQEARCKKQEARCKKQDVSGKKQEPRSKKYSNTTAIQKNPKDDLMNTRVIVLLMMLSTILVRAQQDAQFTQYMYNTININPAYAGSRGAMSIFGLYRTQWVGLDGAPQTGTFSINTPIEGTNIGLGLSVMNDRIGPGDETNIAVDFAYTVKTSENWKLAFGLKASANLLNIDFNKVSQFNGPGSDQNLRFNIDSRFSPNIGAGLYWYSEKSYIGLSIPNFLETRHFDRSSTATTGPATSFTAKERMNLYFIVGKVIDLSEDIKFKPALLSKIVAGAPLQVDLSGNFMFNEKFVLGAAYRWSAAVSLMAGFQVNDSWYIGYGYDLETTRLANYNSGSHEIFLRYELFKNYDRIISPRFF